MRWSSIGLHHETAPRPGPGPLAGWPGKPPQPGASSPPPGINGIYGGGGVPCSQEDRNNLPSMLPGPAWESTSSGVRMDKGNVQCRLQLIRGTSPTNVSNSLKS